MRLGFPDASFDAVVAPFVMTVVPDPAATLEEFARVLRPGGEIVLVNHVGAEQGPRAAVERWLGRRSASLGWRPEFPFATIGDWITARPDMSLLERRDLPPLSLFTLVRIGKAGGV
jgi:phosphatidylethanolamine/phosphatidyl-N-methylethanolamine N-methyltransferase